MKERIDKTASLFCILMILVLAMYIASFIIIGCRSPYPTCSTERTYRCNGTVVEMCDGKNWNPRLDCGAISFNGEDPVAYECVESGDNATCEDIK
jgi:hypothetical protein